MRKKRVLVKNEISKIIFSDRKVKISKSDNNFFFEIGKEITDDIAEAVSLLILICDDKHPIWNMNIIDFSLDITPAKSLFWLTGGNIEWNGMEHYKIPWHLCYLDFQSEFGMIILNIVKKSIIMRDIKDGFLKYVNLPILYNFAIESNLIK